MSLRAFHLFFILLSILLSAGCAWWAFNSNAGALLGVCFALISVSLAVYGYLFFKKSQKLIL